ncbi:hypothetical protein BDV93DRAFT_601116 [Ceratobasidium sp. AG-I]|nr:hypothetical protein BDV93DRAFT_601116 [Ceratobasidium sp. AG-I]
MSNPLFDSAPEYDSDLDTLADFVIEPTTVHVPPPPSPAPNTCLCGRTTRDDDSDEPLYCSEACARLDAFHALTARSRSNSLAPTPIHTAPTTPLGLHTPLRESFVMPFNVPDAVSTPPFMPTPLSNCSSLASIDSAGLPIEMGSHYRRVHAKRERMERRASEERERSRSHSRAHSKARPSLSELEEECLVETQIERESGSDGEDHVPAPPGVFVHVAVDVQVEHEDRNDDDDDHSADGSDVTPAPMMGPAPGMAWHDPFADSALPPPTQELLAPHYASDSVSEADVLSITDSELSPFVAYAPVAAPPPGLRTRKSSVCFAGVGPAGRVESVPVPIRRSRAQSDSKSRLGSAIAFSEKPLPPTPDHCVEAPKEDLETHPESGMESADVPAEPCSLSEGVDGSSLSSLTLDQSSTKSSEVAEPTTPVSATTPESPRTPNGRIHPDEVDPLATPSRLSSSPEVVLDTLATPKRSPIVSPRTNASRKPQAIDTDARAKIFSMVLDPELDVFGGELVDSFSVPPLKRAETAPELNAAWGSDAQPVALGSAWSPQTPHKERHARTRARAISTPRRPAGEGRQRTTSTPSHPGLLQLAPKTPRRARMHVPPPTPPVSPSHVSSPRPPVAQDPGSWQSFGAAFDAWGWNMQGAGEGMHRRQESGESTGSSATDVSWASSSGAPLSGSSMYSWPASGDTSVDAESDMPSILRARSPATSSVRTVVPPMRSSSLAGLDLDESESMHLHLRHPRRSRRHSSIAALDSILAMEDGFWGTDPVVVRPADGSMETEGVMSQFAGDAGSFSFPAEKDKATFAPVLGIAGASRPPSMVNLLNPNADAPYPRSRLNSGMAKVEHLVGPHAHRLSPSQFPSSPSLASAHPSPEVEVSASPALAHLRLFDGPMSASPIPTLSRGSPAPANPSPVSFNFAPRTPSSPYLSVPLSPSRRGSKSTDASSVLLRTASAARLAAALNAATEDDEEERHGHEEHPHARYSPGKSLRMRRSGSEGRASSLSTSSGLGLGLVLEHDSRARSSSEPWAGTVPGSVILPGVVVPGTVSRSGSRMNHLNPTTSVLEEEEEEEEEDYGQVVSGSKFSGMATSPVSPSAELGEEASPLIDAFPHPEGGYFPGSRFASRVNTPVRGLKSPGSTLSLRQVATGVTAATKEPEAAEEEESEGEDEDEEVVTTVQRMRHSMQLLMAA